MPRAGLTPEIIIERAAEMADRSGLDAVNLNALAASFGVKSPSLYKHVASLDAVMHALALRGLNEATARLQRATMGRSRDEALLALAHAYRRFATERPGLYAATQRQPKTGENDIARAGEAMLGALAAALAGFGLLGDDARHAMRGLRAIIHGFVSLDAAGSFRLKPDAGASFDRLVSSFAASLGTEKLT